MEEEQKCVDCAFYIDDKPHKDHYCPLKQPSIEKPEEPNDCKYFGHTGEGLFNESD